MYSCEDVASKYEGVKVAQKGSITRIGGFSIQPIEVEHNVPCYAYIVRHVEFGKLLFITDCSSFTYKIKDVNHILCECNWDECTVIDNALSDEYARSMHENHLELGQTLEIVRENFCECTQNVVLLHMSSNNIKRHHARETIKADIGFERVFIAESGLKIELKENDF